MDADDALRRLVEGNERFVAGRSRHPHQSAGWRERLTRAQEPFATVLACSDSRVPTELVFDQGFGDLFVIRVAGNIMSPGVVGTIQYAASHVGTALLVVLGHEDCGAVAAALAPREEATKEPAGVQGVVASILPGLEGLDRTLSPERRLAAAVELNVRWSMRQVLAMPEALKLRVGAKTCLGGVYELGTGRVRWLEQR